MEKLPTFADANALEKTQRAKLLQKLAKDLGEAQKSGDTTRVQAIESQIGGLANDNVVTSQALQEMLEAGGLDRKKAQALIDKYNQDRDGLVNAAEFDQLMTEAKGAKPEAPKPEAPKPPAAPASQAAPATPPAAAAASAQPSEPAAAPTVPPEKVGVVLNDHPNDLPSAAELKEFGATGARITLSAMNYNKDTQAAMKAKLAEYKAAGIEVTLQLGKEFADGCPEPEDSENKPVDTQSPAWNKKFDDWMDKSYLPRVNEAMAELGQYVDSVEAFNEPDEPNNRSKTATEDAYKPGLPAEKFGEALRKTYEAVHNHPNAQDDVKVITGGLDSGHPEYLERAAAATKDKDGNPTLYADEIGLHPYDKDANKPANDPRSLGFIVNDYAKRDWKTPTGKTPSVYITEASQPRVENAKTFNGDFARATVEMDAVTRSYFFWKKTHDEHPGLVSADGTKSDAYYELQRLMGKGTGKK